jgi:membrane associated rhomboid family serine protease
MFPIATNLKLIRTPWATYAIIGTNVLVHFIVTWNTNLVIPSEMARTLGFVPASFGDLSTSHTFVTCIFLHGDLIHLSGNMLFLLVFGRRVESEFDTTNFLAFYLTAGVAAGLVHAIMESDSFMPLIGASGAISGVLGAFFIYNPTARITLVLDPALIYFLRRLTIHLPAWVFLPMWFFLQISTGLNPHPSNVAFWAHVGGFLAGVLVSIAVHQYISDAHCSLK